MVGRRRPAGRRRRSGAKQVKIPTNMYVADTTFNLASLSALSNNLFTIFDNSGTAGNKTVMFTKLTVSWGGQITDDEVPLVVAVGRQKEGGVALDVDDADAVRDYINDNHMLRGPWMMFTRFAGANYKYKTMVFKKLMLDANDDLVLHVTPLIALDAQTNKIHLYYKGFYRIVD